MLMTKMLSVKDGYDNKSESQSQHSCLKFKFPAKTINQSGSRREKPAGFPPATSRDWHRSVPQKKNLSSLRTNY